MIRMALNLLIVLVPLQMVLGDLHGANTLKYQPAKFAAIEGRYDTVQPLPLTLFAHPRRCGRQDAVCRRDPRGLGACC